MTFATTLSLALTLLPQGDDQQPAPQIEWQRSLADALAVQKETGLPLLIAVNMNGEVFNDRFRTRTYKEPAFVESTQGYVCVVASPDRHNDRDYDSLGNRIECPAFPGCTCGEHIAIEPELFARYFNSQRNAPRHVGVSPDGQTLFDRFLDRSMQTAIDAISRHRGKPSDRAVPKTIKGQLESRSAASRRALEDTYRQSHDPAILQAAGEADNEPFDLLRLALHSEDFDEFRQGLEALIQTATAAALADLENALARDPLMRDPLLDCIARLAETDERTARLHAHLTHKTDPVDGPWRNDWREPAYEILNRAAVEAELDACELGLRKTPEDHGLRLRLATAQLAFAKVLIATGGSGIEFWLEDAVNSTKRIVSDELQAEAQAIMAAAAWLSNDPGTAAMAAKIALASAHSDRRPNAWLATSLFEVIVLTDTTAAYAKVTDHNVVMHPEVARVHAAMQLLDQSRWITEQSMLTGIGLLEYAGLRHEACDLLATLVRRFPTSPTVHERWRTRAMLDFGAEQMRFAAVVVASEADDKGAGEWYAGYAALIAAETHVRDQRRELAVTAYTDSIARLIKSGEINPDYRDSANHFAVLALAGRAMAQHELGRSHAAVADLVRAKELRSASLTSGDGLHRTPRSIARDITRALETAGQTELARNLSSIAN